MVEQANGVTPVIINYFYTNYQDVNNNIAPPVRFLQVIPPLSNTTFDVVFLGRGEGEIKSTLFIHTSEGSFKYYVSFTYYG